MLEPTIREGEGRAHRNGRDGLTRLKPRSRMSDCRLQRYRAYARFVRSLLFFGGIYLGKRERGLVYRQISSFSILSGVIVVCALGNCCLQNISNLSLLTKSLGLFGSIVAVTLKALLFRIHRKELCKVSEILDGLFEDGLQEARLRPVLLSLLPLFYRPAHVLAATMVAIMSLYIVKPVIAIVVETRRSGTVEHYLLPFPGTYPWPTGDSGLLYRSHYIFEVQFAWFVICITSGVDNLFGFYTLQISAMLRALVFEFQTLHTRENVGEAFRSCVEKHVRLLECRDILEKIYGPIVLLMALTNALIMCTLVFQVFQAGGMSVDKAALFVFYISVKIGQTFMYAFYGHIVTSESETLRREVCYIGWYESCFKRLNLATSVLIVTTQRPIVLSACRFFAISLEFFVRILNTTMSYFFLLKTLDDDSEYY